ncbi:uncharacterized protein LOC113315595 [Papaver somniferum]|uniref:uncharacterized protein LOC113315595 n=1 Tax=Papaver somniferum TaxID=3469 RepID=UPI000E6F6D45|nr:uncharacterized protein LOC113315595 [Papaver somniferum]
MYPSSSEIDADLERFRRFHPGGTLLCVPNAKNLSNEEVRGMFNISKSVKFTKMMNPTDPVCNDEVVVNLYQLACGFSMPVDSFTRSLLNAWGISSHQMHPSLCSALKRVLSIFKTYHRFILPADVQKFITPLGGQIPDDDSSDVRIEKFFDLPRSLFDVSLSDEFVDWRYDRDLNANEISTPTHAVPLNQRPGVTVIESDSESYDGCSPKAPEMNSIETDYLQGSSSPSSLIRIRRRHYKTKTAGATSSGAHDFGVSNGKTRFKRLRKVNAWLTKDILLKKQARVVQCCPVGGIAPAFDGNRESTNSGSSDEVLGTNTESSNDISSGCPSPFTDLGDAEVPSGREAVRGNDFSNTLFADDTSSSKDNATTSHDAALSPDCRETTRDNEESVIQPSLPSEPLSNFAVFSDVGMMGSGSTNPCPENENVRVCRPTSIPQSDPGISRPSVASPSPVQSITEPDHNILLQTMTEHFNQFLKFATQLNGVLRQHALEGGADAGLRLENIRLESKNSELSVATGVLTEELAGARQELANSKSRELQLKLSLEEIGGVLPDSWEN